MTCDEIRSATADFLRGNLSASQKRNWDRHLAACTGCPQQIEQVRDTWERLGLLSAPAPSPLLRERFYEWLDEQQISRAAQPAAGQTAPGWWLRWSQQPGWQLCTLLLCLAGGYFAGQASHRSPGPDVPQITELRGEVDRMRQLVTLSLLQQQSPTERLRGVNWAYRVERDDAQVLTALLRTVSADPNVNVRLSAVDALRNFADMRDARQGAIDALKTETSPLVQVALIDLLADLRERQAIPALKALANRDGVDPNVGERARMVLTRVGL